MRKHPDTELIDRLRAGLLDELPEEKQALEDHIASCPECQAQLDHWEQLTPSALGPELDNNKLQRDLENARRHALTANRPHPIAALVPYATAALLLIAISAGVWNLYPEPDFTQQTAQGTQVVPDIYEDVDFYLWLANQEESPANADSPGNADNT